VLKLEYYLSVLSEYRSGGIMTPQTRAFSICVALGWILLWLLASVVYRRVKGKPIFRPVPENPVFAETWRSGCSLKSLLTRMGGARNCLWVTIDHGLLQIALHFPFNLLFLPEIYDLEFSVPGAAIRSAELREGFLTGNRVRVTIERTSGREERFDLFLREPKAFLEALAAIRQGT
jgi:hypothetical protein